MNLEEAVKQHIKQTEQTFSYTVKDQNVVTAMQSDIDYLMGGYQKGQELYLTQACYACHRISGFARGGIGPELTNEGEGIRGSSKSRLYGLRPTLKPRRCPTTTSIMKSSRRW